MHPKMPIQICLIKFLGQPILKFYRTTMILDDITIILAKQCDFSKIFFYKFCSEMSVNFKLYIHPYHIQIYMHTRHQVWCAWLPVVEDFFNSRVLFEWIFFTILANFTWFSTDLKISSYSIFSVSTSSATLQVRRCCWVSSALHTKQDKSGSYLFLKLDLQLYVWVHNWNNNCFSSRLS